MSERWTDMCRKDDKEEILAAVQQLGVRLDALEALLRKSDAKAAVSYTHLLGNKVKRKV